MPRINNKIRSSKKTAASYYSHNENYISQTKENHYTKKDSLILWSDFCVETKGAATIAGPSDIVHSKTAGDRSLDAANMTIYANTDSSVRTFKQSDTAKRQYLTSLLPRLSRSYLSLATMDLCGDNCFWLNLAASSTPAGGDETGCRASSVGSDSLLIEKNTAINFANAGATQDTPFTISVWYYPIDSTTNPNAVYNKGGITRNGAASIFHKTFQYGLFIKECGKLEFTLFDVVASSTKQASGALTYLGTSATLSVRSTSSILTPAEWNHICVTYDGSGTRAGMKIYVNCNDATNSADVPAVVAARSHTYSGTDATAWELVHTTFMANMYASQGEGETPSSYVAMHSYNTPLVFASTVVPSNATSLSGAGVSITKMDHLRGTQLPNSLIFDIAIWSSALSAEDVGAVCDATRSCIISYSDVYGRDSGYINLSPKIMQKIRDQKQNNLSVIDRIGDRSNRKVKARKGFDDNNTLIFGRKISDELKKGNFKFLSLNLTRREKAYGIPVAGLAPDKSLWISQNASIRREQKIDSAGDTSYDKALALHPTRRDPSSWIQTKEKVNNAIIYYDLILGPYNKKLGHLNLDSVPSTGTNLFIEVQTADAGPWKVIKTHTIAGNTVLTTKKFYSPNFFSSIILSPKQHQFRRSFSIHFSDINTGGAAYKIRFRTAEACWGIGRIEILSADQTVRHPISIDHESYSGKYIDQNFIATPHTKSDITSTGRSMSGISDNSIYFTDDDQGTIPFKDNLMLPFAGNVFFDEGIETSIIPGFSSPLKDKTLLTIELNSATEKSLVLSTQSSDQVQTL